MKDQSPTISEPSPKPEGGSFLTKEPAKPDPEPKPEVKPEAKDGDAPKPDDKKPDPAKPDAPVGAPEKYEDFKLPDGFKLDAKILPEVQGLFKDLNLPQEGAQKLIDFYAKNLRAAEEAPYKAWADLNKQWMDEIGERFGSRAEAIRTDIREGINNALPPTLAKNLNAALDITGAGSNPDIVEALSILVKPHLEGKPVGGGRPSPEGQKQPGAAQISMADAMYPHLRK